MNIIDYTGKLNNHQEYVNVLDKVEIKCKYIEIVVLDGRKSNELIDKFSEDILEIKKVSKWWGTETRERYYLYRIKSSKKIFVYLRSYEILIRGDYSEITNFGIDDIAFYDNNDCLLCTTTNGMKTV